MDVKTARQVRNHLFKSVEELTRALKILEAEYSDLEYKKYRNSCGSIVADIWESQLGPIFREHPKLKPKEVRGIPF